MIIKFKLYESKNSANLKRYAIWYWANYDDYDIIEITKIETTIFWCRNIYCYNNIENKLDFVNSYERHTAFSGAKDIIFSSDNLKECLEELETLIAAEKYNL